MDKVAEKVNVFKQIMGRYPTGVTIVTTIDDSGVPAGLTVNSFASVSIDPLMVLWCIDKRSSSLSKFVNTEKFAVHTLASDQTDACWTFAGKEQDKFAKVNWVVSKNDLPILVDSLGVLECQTVQQIDAGDHIIFLGEVIELSKKPKEPLLYFNRNIGEIPLNWPN